MDPFSSEGELVNIYNNFFQGQWQAVIDFDTASLSPQNVFAAKVLALRAHIALGEPEDVVANVRGAEEPELQAVGALARYATGNTDAAIAAAEELVASHADNATVQLLCGSVLQAAGRTEEALSLLSRHQGNSKLDMAPCQTKKKECLTLSQSRPSRSLCRSTCSKTEQTWR